ncbi:MAG: TraR/DksA C4-type zinc finger protein [Acidimicrobiales bacterium]
MATTESDDSRTQLLVDRARAIEQRDALARELEDIIASTELVATDDEHDPEGHTIAFERQQIAGLLREAQVHVVDVDDALARLQGGTYGTCEACGRPVPGERLAILPATRTCVTCASSS